MGQSSESSAGRLTTHVLDTATGLPAAGLQVDLFRLDGGEPIPIVTVTTNADGRCNAPLLAGEGMVAGTYQLVFAAGDYFRAQGLVLAEPLFFDLVPLRFGISEPARHYHVPLLLTPFGYTTYRGS